MSRRLSQALRLGGMMSIQGLFWTCVAIVALVFVPATMIWSIIDHLRGKGSERRGGSGTISAGIGAAMLELDRLMTRPSVEHQVEAERPILKREDDAGGD